MKFFIALRDVRMTMVRLSRISAWWTDHDVTRMATCRITLLLVDGTELMLYYKDEEEWKADEAALLTDCEQ